MCIGRFGQSPLRVRCVHVQLVDFSQERLAIFALYTMYTYFMFLERVWLRMNFNQWDEFVVDYCTSINIKWCKSRTFDLMF